MQEEADQDHRSLAVRIGAVGAWVLLYASAIALFFIADAMGPHLFSWTTFAFAGATSSASLRGVMMYVLFFLAPYTALFVVFWLTREAPSPLFRLISMAVVFGVAPPFDLVETDLGPVAAASFLRLGKLQLQVMAAGFGLWLLFRFVRWIVKDEQGARCSDEMTQEP